MSGLELDYISKLLTYICYIFISFFVAFTLTGEEIKKITNKLALISVAFVFVCLNFEKVIPFEIALLALIIILKIILKRSFLFIAMTILLSINLFMVELYISGIINSIFTYINKGHSDLYIKLTIVVIHIAIGVFVYIKTPSLFPLSAKKYLSLEKCQRKNFEFKILIIIFVLVMYFVWTIHIIKNFSIIPLKIQSDVYFFTIFIFIFCLYFMRVTAFNAVERIESAINKKYRDELLSLMEVIRAQRHDFNFHLQAISSMIQNENYCECHDYVNQMVKDASNINDVLPIYHPAVSVLLTAFREKAKSIGIELELLIYSSLKDINCTPYELNRIIGNLLQNAIDQVRKDANSPSKIEFLMKREGNNLIIKVSNNITKTTDCYKNIFNFGYSTKEGHEGIGLNTVKNIVDKYCGIVFFEIKENVIEFVVKMPY